MKKIVLSLLALAATMNIMAVTYSAKATITLESKSNYESCQIIIGESNELAAGLNNGEYAEINMDGRSVALYVEYDGVNYQHFASDPATMKNLTLKAKTNAAENYNLIISDVTGAFTLKLGDAEPVAIAAGTQVIALNKNDEYAIGVINYEEPAPSCVTVRNNLVVDRYYTICLPQEIASFTGASFWSMSKRGEGIAYLEEEVAPLTAGQPYIFQAEAEELCVVYGNAVPAAEAGVAGALAGTFAPMGQADLDGVAIGTDIYLLYDNELWKVNGQEGNSLAANRAYVVYNNLIPENPAPAPGRRVRAIPMANNVPTAVENIDAAEAPAKTIIDGKLYIIRGEQMYDATGRLVK